MKRILLIFAMGTFMQISAQEAKVQDLFALETELLLPKAGLSFEKSIGNTFSIKPSVLYGIGSVGSSNGGDSDDFETISTLFTSLQLRHYTNLKRRVGLDKSIANNSGNYLALDFGYIPDLGTTQLNENVVLLKTFSTSLLYGMQRQMFKSGLSFYLYGGLGFVLEEDRSDLMGDGDSYLAPRLNLGFNYMIPVRKK